MSIRLVALLPLLCCSRLNTTSAQEQLRWKFRSGDHLEYTVVQNMNTSMKFGEQEVKSKFNQTIEMSWDIQSVAASGDTVLNQIFNRVRLQMVGGPAGEIEFDTATKEIPTNPIVKQLGTVFGNIVGQKFQVTMKPTGQVDNVNVPEQLLAAVRQSEAGKQGALTESMLKDMMKQSAVMLPAQPVGPGSRWKSEQEVQMPFGTMTIVSSMNFVQKDANGNAVIDFVPTVNITPRDGVQTRMSLDESNGRGRIIFDIARGRVVQTQLDLTLKMTVEQSGQKLPQVIRNVTSMTLAQ